MTSPGPHVTWAGVVVKLSDGSTHAIEFTDDRTTADIQFDSSTPGYTRVWLQGRGRYWAEGADLNFKMESRRELPPGQNVIEAG